MRQFLPNRKIIKNQRVVWNKNTSLSHLSLNATNATVQHFNETPRRKRARYQSGLLKSNLYLVGHVVSPQTPVPLIYPTASGRGIIKGK